MIKEIDKRIAKHESEIETLNLAEGLDDLDKTARKVTTYLQRKKINGNNN